MHDNKGDLDFLKEVAKDMGISDRIPKRIVNVADRHQVPWWVVDERYRNLGVRSFELIQEAYKRMSEVRDMSEEMQPTPKKKKEPDTGTAIVRYRFKIDGTCTARIFQGCERYGRYTWKLGSSTTRLSVNTIGNKVVSSGNEYFFYDFIQDASFEKARDRLISYLQVRLEETIKVKEKLELRLANTIACKYEALNE